ncbi:MAG: polyprenyl synthetase family protein, partial [Gemmatimonadales bacterium]|nr:polyprenyl synthetase family protein [Gemmatimonadales bacterium]
MVSVDRIELALHRAVAQITGDGCPPGLARAVEYAVFPAGHRFRPRLSVAVAEALGTAESDLALSAAVAVELLHCASLVQDDLPAFDDAALRRDRPSLH